MNCFIIQTQDFSMWLAASRVILTGSILTANHFPKNAWIPISQIMSSDGKHSLEPSLNLNPP